MNRQRGRLVALSVEERRERERERHRRYTASLTPEQLRAKNYRRRNARRHHDITPTYEAKLRAKAKHCPMPGCGVRLTNDQYQPTSKELDHIIPIVAGGTHTIGNVRIICRLCNQKRPTDGSDVVGQVTLWAQDPSVAPRAARR
jgi:HNH endonuclease